MSVTLTFKESAKHGSLSQEQMKPYLDFIQHLLSECDVTEGEVVVRIHPLVSPQGNRTNRDFIEMGTANDKFTVYIKVELKDSGRGPLHLLLAPQASLGLHAPELEAAIRHNLAKANQSWGAKLQTAKTKLEAIDKLIKDLEQQLGKVTHPLGYVPLPQLRDTLVACNKLGATADDATREIHKRIKSRELESLAAPGKTWIRRAGDWPVLVTPKQAKLAVLAYKLLQSGESAEVARLATETNDTPVNVGPEISILIKVGVLRRDRPTSPVRLPDPPMTSIAHRKDPRSMESIIVDSLLHVETPEEEPMHETTEPTQEVVVEETQVVANAEEPVDPADVLKQLARVVDLTANFRAKSESAKELRQELTESEERRDKLSAEVDELQPQLDKVSQEIKDLEEMLADSHRRQEDLAAKLELSTLELAEAKSVAAACRQELDEYEAELDTPEMQRQRAILADVGQMSGLLARVEQALQEEAPPTD